MLVTVTNTTNVAPQVSRTINKPDQGGFGRSPDAVSSPEFNQPGAGALTDPLPYPFDITGPLAAGASKQLPMHVGDLRYQRSPGCFTRYPFEDFNVMINAGVISAAVASETGSRDFGDQFTAAI